MPELTIAIAKGRLQTEALPMLANAGVRLTGDADSRCLARSDETGRSRYIFVKPSDVPVYVEHGIADCGLVGLDILLEYEADVLQPVSLPIARCQIAVAGPVGQPKNGYAMLRVATKYPRIAARHFGTRGQPVEIAAWISRTVEVRRVSLAFRASFSASANWSRISILHVEPGPRCSARNRFICVIVVVVLNQRDRCNQTEYATV